jgi:hypothetical protein
MSSLVYPPGQPCMWCKAEDATTTIYGTPTGVACAVSRQARVSRWLKNLGRVQGVTKL